MDAASRRAEAPSRRVYIVEDHALMRETLAEFVEDEPGWELCGCAANAETALHELSERDADLALIDVALSGMSGIDLVPLLVARQPALRCVMLSGHAESSYVGRAFAAGARGYVLKGDPASLVEAMETVARGERYVSAGLGGDGH